MHAMKILITGSSGLIGSAVIEKLQQESCEILRLVRVKSETSDPVWDPEKGLIDKDRLTGIDAVIHLAGENIAAGRWTASKKARILDSRVQGTKLIAETIAALEPTPKVMISASATGYYGNREDEILDEQSRPGTVFLADVCKQWEQAADPARSAGIRVVHIRTGMVLSSKGGALPKMLRPFKIGLGGVIGSGRQYMSWIAIDDEVSAIWHILNNHHISGPVNLVSPTPVTNREFTKTIGKVIKRPTLFPVPGIALRTILGEMAGELLLSSTRAIPKRLLESGFEFKYAGLEQALKQQMKKKPEG